MRIKKIMLVACLLLIILTIGAVSASDDNATSDELTAEPVDDVETSINDNAQSAMQSQDNDVISEKQNVTMYFDMPSEVYSTGRYEGYTGNEISFSERDVTGNVQFFIDDVKCDEVDVSFTGRIYAIHHTAGLDQGIHGS